MTSSVKSPPHTRHRAALAVLVIALIVAAVAFSSGRVSSQGSSPQQRDLERVFKQHERLTLDPGQIARQVKQTRSLTLATSRGIFEMMLEPHDMRAPNYRAEATTDKGVRVLERTPVRTYKGTVHGLPGAQARMTIDEGIVEGLIITSQELLFLEPAKRYSNTASQTDFVFYAASDVKAPAGECGNTMAQTVAQHSARVSNQTSAKGPHPEALFGPVLEIDIATDADFEYFNVFGANTIPQIQSIMSQVEGIYDAQLGIQFKIVFQHVYETSNDPYTLTNVTGNPNIISEFQDYWNTNRTSVQRDTVHLWTGKDIDGDTIGIAYQPGLDCPFNPGSFAYGISQHLTSGNANLAGLTAHEIGHNLSAIHVNSNYGSDCASLNTTSIMNPSISPSQNFCQFSRDQITEYTVEVKDCLTSLNQGCTYSISPSLQTFSTSAGNGSVNITTSSGCNWAVAEGARWLTATNSGGTGNGTVNYSVTSNTQCGPRTTQVDIGGQILTVQQAGKPDYMTDLNTATAITPGQLVNGDLSLADCPTALSGHVNAAMDRYKFNGMAGQQIRIEMTATSPDLDTYLYLIGPNGSIVAQNDDIWLANQTNSRIPCVNVPNGPCAVEFYTLQQTGTYIIVTTSFSNYETGTYSLTLTSVPMLLTAQVTDVVGTTAALNSVTFQRTSNTNNTAFRIFDPFNFSSDQTTRLILFTSDLGLPSQQNPDPNVLSVRAGGIELVVENVGPFTFPGLSGSYVVVALKARQTGQTVPTNQTVGLTVTCRVDPSNGQALVSNAATITIVP